MSKSRFVRALRAKGYTPASVLQRLGLDSSFLRGDDETLEQEEALLKRRGMSTADIQRLIDVHTAVSDPRGKGGGPGEIVGVSGDDMDDMTGQQIVDKYGSFDADPPIVHPAALQNEGGEDDEPDEYSDFASFCRDRGMDESAIKTAIDAHRSYRRGDRRPNGHDKGRGSRDEFPLKGVRSSERPPPSRGHFAGPRRSGETASGGAMDAAARKRLARRYPGLARIECLPSVSSSDRRLATDKARTPSRAKTSRTLRRFPELANIRTSGDVDYAFRDAAQPRGRFEV
jgi:hypothetical protein